MLATVSFMFDDLAEDRNIVAIAAIYFVFIFMLSVQDISVDGKDRSANGITEMYRIYDKALSGEVNLNSKTKSILSK